MDIRKKAAKKGSSKPSRSSRPTKSGAIEKKPARTAARARTQAGRKTARPRVAPRRKARPSAAAKAPTRDPVRELAREIVDVTVSHDDDAAFALYADDVESMETGMPPTRGIDAIRQKFSMWRNMVTASSWQAPGVWVDGNTIIIEWEGRVTRAADGRTVDMKEIAIHEVRDGKIVRERFYYDPSVLQS